jgi:phosphohistidine phosphatase
VFGTRSPATFADSSTLWLMDDDTQAADLELYLLRHAHAGNASQWTGDDSLRPLSAKGRRQAEKLGRHLADLRFEPDSILSSPKLRALETAQIVADSLGVGVITDERLASGVDLDVLGAIVSGDGGRQIMLVGHDPDLSDICGELVGVPYLALKKGALARVDVSVPLARGAGTLRWLLPPDAIADRHEI